MVSLSSPPGTWHLEEFLGQLSTLSEESKTKLVKELTLEELEINVMSSPNGKSPGLDGLPHEFFKTMWEFLEVIKDQMRNFCLIASGRHGAKVTPSKVE